MAWLGDGSASKRRKSRKGQVGAQVGEEDRLLKMCPTVPPGLHKKCIIKTIFSPLEAIGLSDLPRASQLV